MVLIRFVKVALCIDTFQSLDVLVNSIPIDSGISVSFPFVYMLFSTGPETDWNARIKYIGIERARNWLKTFGQMYYRHSVFTINARSKKTSKLYLLEVGETQESN